MSSPDRIDQIENSIYALEDMMDHVLRAIQNQKNMATSKANSKKSSSTDEKQTNESQEVNSTFTLDESSYKWAKPAIALNSRTAGFIRCKVEELEDKLGNKYDSFCKEIVERYPNLVEKV